MIMSRSAPPQTEELHAHAQRARGMIAEDLDWSLSEVPLLTTLCLQNIVVHFSENPILEALGVAHRAFVVRRLSTRLPLSVTAELIPDQSYWRRCCETRWTLLRVQDYGGSWKRMFFERHLENLVESFIPNSSDLKELLDTARLCGNHVKRLRLSQLLPPLSPEQGVAPVSVLLDASTQPSADHLDLSVLLKELQQLEELEVVYRVKACGMNFERRLFELTARDCKALARALRSSKTLQVFRISHSRVDDERCGVLVRHLLDHASLRHLDLSHNFIGDAGARALAKLLLRSRLETLTLYNNRIRGAGARALAHALSRGSALASLNLRLNSIGDEGGQAMAEALVLNTNLLDLHLEANNLTEPSAVALAQALLRNFSLLVLDLSNNTLGDAGWKLLEDAVSQTCGRLNCDVMPIDDTPGASV